MANLVQKVTNSFIKGLITEAGELTFPENASIDEDNCELFRDGTRRRRKAIAIEENNSLSSFTVSESTQLNFGIWENVGNSSSKSYLVVQVGPSLYFYNRGQFPFSGQEISGYVSLLPYEVAGAATSVAFTDCSFTSALGSLVVVSPSMEPILIEEGTSGFTVTTIDCFIRDLSWMTCKENYDEGVPTASVTAQREYDTANSGWVGDLGGAALTAYTTSQSEYPPLTHPWYSGKDASGNFSVTEWLKIYSGSSLIGNGHFILNLFDRDRSSVSGISGLDVEIEETRFTCTTTFSGRVFFSGLTSAENSGKIFYSQVLTNLCSIGDFYQQNDPTSEVISDLLETDGGVISIPDARNIKVLYAFYNSMFVFAENGVWQIKGVDDVFSPTAYSVSKITEIGIQSPGSFTAAEGVPFWWSRYGIHTLSFNEFGRASEENLSISTIQTLWNSIDSSAKDTVRTTYDKVNKKIIWLYKTNGESLPNKYNKVLILDVALQAFYPWSFSDETSLSDYVVGLSFYPGFGTSETTFDVVLSSEEDVVVASGDDVVSTQTAPLSLSAISVVFMVRDTSESKMTMAIVNDRSFLDWGTADYISYAVTGYDFLDSVTTKKTAPYIVVYTRETETSFAEQSDGGFLPDYESSLLVSCFWDFKKLPSSIPQQAYKRNQPVIPNSSTLTFDSPSTVLTSKLKVRGSGKSLRIKFESETGKDFIYIGHGLIADVTRRF